MAIKFANLSSKERKLLEVSRVAVRNAKTVVDLTNTSWIDNLSSRSGWAMAPDSLKFLVRLIAQFKPLHILEFGSGVSTYVMARACTQLKKSSSITSIDHDPEFGKTTVERLLNKFKLHCRISFQLAPLVARDFGGKTLPIYHLQDKLFASTAPVDLVLIDGPPVMLGGREGVLYQTMGFARPGTVVILDDANRSEEKTIIGRWRDILRDAIEVKLFTRFTKGLAVIVIVKPVEKHNLFTRRINVSAKEIGKLISKSKSFILVGEEWWIRDQIASGRKVIPFTEKNCQYWGPPPNDNIAIEELERLRTAGASHIVFLWPSFWWLDYYVKLHHYLRSKFPCVLENDRLVIFDIRK